MSRKVREWLKLLEIVTTHEERIEVDREIEERKGVNCDEAIEKGLVSKAEFMEIVEAIKKREKKKLVESYVV